MKDLIDIPNGSLGVGEKEKDFMVGSTLTIEEIEKRLPKIELDRIFLDQSKHPFTHRCTSMSALSACCTYDQRELLYDDLLEFNRYCEKEYDWMPGVGNYTQTGVKIALEWYNKKFSTSFAFFKGSWYQEESVALLRKQYQFVATYNGNYEYNKDRDDNGIVDGSDFMYFTYGHAIRGGKVDGLVMMGDTYPTRGDTNYYQLKSPIMLVDNKVFYQNIYFIIPMEHLEESIEMKKTKRIQEMYGVVSSHMWNGINNVRDEIRTHDHDHIAEVLDMIKTTKASVDSLLK